jgi:hypothetical protein
MSARNDRYVSLLLPFSLVGLAALAWAHRFILDDAYISFRYADHLVQGHGLVWNIGERVEGITNLLWTLLIAGAMATGFDPVLCSYGLGLASFVASLALTFRLVVELNLGRTLGLLTATTLGLNYSFFAFATSGLETQFQAMLFTAAALLVVREERRPQPSISAVFVLSLILATALWTRLDSGIVVGLLTPFVYWRMVRRSRGRQRIYLLTAFTLPALAGGLALVAFKLSYYGELLPNTFQAKASSAPLRGVTYLLSFLLNYWLAPLAVLAIAAVPAALRHRSSPLWLVLVGSGAWLAYVVAIGGDFMEYRMLVPALPLLYAGGAWLLGDYIKPKIAQVALLVAVVLGSAHHYWRTHEFPLLNGAPGGVETIPALRAHLDAPVENWVELGRSLGELFQHDPRVVIAVTAAGAIPYYSKLTTIDMHGLNDRWIARHGVVASARPGHQRIAPMSYLLERKVNFVIKQWSKGDPGEEVAVYWVDWLKRYVDDLSAENLPQDAVVVELPIGADRRLRALYLTRTLALDAYVLSRGWKAIPILR